MTAQPTIPAYFVRQAVDLATKSGVDLTYPLSMAGIGSTILDNPAERLTTRQVTAFTQAVWAMTGDELTSTNATNTNATNTNVTN